MDGTLRDVALVARLAAQLTLANGGETYRAEDSARYIGLAFGYETDVMAFPTGLTLTLSAPGGETLTLIGRVPRRTVDLTKLDNINRVVRALSAGKARLDEAMAELEALCADSPTPAWRYALLAGGSAGMFAVMFGGRPFSALAAFISGALAQWLVSSAPVNKRLTPVGSLIAGCVCALSALLLSRVSGAGEADLITISAMMPFLPGLAITNAIRDSMSGDLVSGSTRAGEAFMTAVLLTAGVGLAMWLWRFAAL